MKISCFSSVIGILFLAFSCTVVREERLLKKNTAAWRESPAVLSAYADSPFAGSFLTLRENKHFERTSSGLFKSFAAGTWTINADTIHLLYMDGRQTLLSTEKLLIDRGTSTLVEVGTELPVAMRLRIVSGKM
jgi:hypothetical protein